MPGVSSCEAAARLLCLTFHSRRRHEIIEEAIAASEDLTMDATINADRPARSAPAQPRKRH